MDEYAAGLRVENLKSWLFLLLQMVLVVTIVAFVCAQSTRNFGRWCKKRLQRLARCCCWCSYDVQPPTAGNGSATSSANGLNTSSQGQTQSPQLRPENLHQKVLNYHSKPTLIDEDTLTRHVNMITVFTQLYTHN